MIGYSSCIPTHTNHESGVKIFTRHPNEVGESYVEHFKTASSFGVPMILGGLACLLHGVFPFLFEKSGSKLVTKLYGQMVANRVKAHNFARSSHELDWCI